ncbi:helix-turn-helix domain-containing protein [Anabaena cylindrica FACHB-243]|uniref:Uncharacterized protein n=1 Tax=Anabaena cylindrica (strain ATCC 27899 / PCC 7122) TaxID=272123 RepID=K9ZPU3_ANACC|nr:MULTISPECIES: hypothetical protein [Anabaena]AFZ60814.1 hypothetical protein Anacy_5502 [Anabaena cylindrica PCC 7122]MBD2417114.1 helix-turn-helix domain-containing protein [Anabaena cylindrica FACHB-243]MBY5280810.1 helix-turn-helix domain-containing protein [Anabaena sp. CCAP 1446/1C]MBY5307086.1 helix-turn-helix domain-containing protein [Anabaena sp. CCAP 1446/1C]MCM2406815.1 helix-turn-helix domain-containing protein [Anabaena sp. CCAP 1446/1C]
MKYSDNDKEEVFKLFSAGFTVPQLEEKIPIHRRKLYRLYAEYLVSCNNQKPKKKEDEVKSEIKEVKNLAEYSIDSIENIENIDQEISEEAWLAFALKKSIRGCLRNSLIADKLSDRLLIELEKEDSVNLRAIATYSNAINLHSRLEQSYGCYQILLDPNLAIKTLEARGYIIDNPATINVG